MKCDNIVLIGMPGAGKSTLGVILAKTMKMPFIDTDLLIQQREDKRLQDIINNEGIQHFLAVEESAILELTVKNHIIATGGSVVYSDTAMQHLKAGGCIIYLELGFDEIEQRIKNIKTRGIAMGKGQGLQDLYNERIPLYEKYADMIIACSGKNDEQVVEEIVQKFKTNGSKIK